MDVYDGSINEIEELNNMSSGRSPISVYYSEEEEYYSSDESHSSNVVESPGGKTKLWKPNVPKVFMPDTNARFQSLDEAIKMYSLYAEKARFDIRLNTTKRFNDKTIKIKYVVCNRNGKIPDKSVDTLEIGGSGRSRRNSNFIITDCKALIIFERQHIGSNIFRIKDFQELHNHPLDTKEDRRCSRKARKLDFKDKEFIVRASKANIGPTKAHKLRACLEGGYEQVGPDVTDYKNFRRNMGNIIGDKDAQIIVDYMNLRKENSENYTFEYKCVNSVLNSMFWCDETDKLYYKEFGDVISFDATFRTNKYGMVFIPFTAIDNHRKSITVGAGLLSNETIESYTWLLESFVKAHGSHPKLLLTDQDPAIKQAVEAVLPDTKHRLCMWHIMKKLQTKVSQDFLINTDFRKRFNKLVWNVYLEPEVFEKNWILLMKEYKLEDKRWFKDMYTHRRSWIPAYFKDVPMHGLMKTTSRSESSNSFFNKFAHHGNLLVYFMMNYDMAIEKQRNNHRAREHATNKTTHEFKMPTGLEHHAANVYTNSIFLEVQKEIYKGAWNCSLENVQMVDGCQIVVITHLDKRMQVKTVCKVELKLPQQEVICSCKLFTRFGILCRHVFAVLKNNRIEKIPDQYILRRWKKGIIDSHLYLRKHGFMEPDDETSKLVSEAYTNMEYCLDAVKTDKKKLISLVEKSRELKKQLEIDASDHNVSDNNEEEVMKLLGINIPNEIDIHVPKGIRNKGCGTKKRIASACEKGSSSSRKKQEYVRDATYTSVIIGGLVKLELHERNLNHSEERCILFLIVGL